MALIGHKTEIMYRRYSIAGEATLREAAQKLARAENFGSSARVKQA
jgi:hypothetical protein